ncbi:MAG: UvrD-helicase domain-containing protein [Planctomycetota bacterium]|jgi:ATP-dependent helicase/nuclease subunit A
MAKGKPSELPDASAREAIVSDLDSNYLVEAGAGTGKTHSLVMRMLSLIATGRCRIDTLVAVTFTKKAASEMRERFQIELERAVADEERDKEERNNLSRALSNLERAFIGTIHSFCGRLLRERPIEAGIDPSFEEVDEIGESALLTEAWNEYVESGANAQRLRDLHTLGFNPGEITEAFLKVSRYPDVEVFYRESGEPDFSEARAEIMAFLERAGAVLPEPEPEGSNDALQPMVRKAFRMARYLDLNETRSVVALIKVFSSAKPNIVQRDWLDKGAAKDLKERYYPALHENVIAPALARWWEYCHGALIKFVFPAVEFARQYRMRKGRLTYQDLLMEAARLLREKPDVRAYFQERFTHMLVDEFQDTDPVQSEIMFFLSCPPGDIGKTDWRKVGLVPGRLFTVGDPKQSIYRFRRADIKTYGDVKERISLTAGHTAGLSTNFRSNPSICEWVNGVFREIFPEGATDRQAAYSSQTSFHSQVPEVARGGVYRLVVPPHEGGKESKEKSNVRTAPLVARLIADAVGGGWRIADEKDRNKTRPAVPGDFLILTRTKEFLSTYAEALEDYGIPCEVTGSKSEDILAAVREILLLAGAVADPADKIKLVAALRGPFFGISDDALYRFSVCGGNFSFLEPPPGDAPPEIGDAFGHLKEYWSWGDTLPPAAAMEKIVSDLGIVPLEASRELGTGRAGILMQFLELARNAAPEHIPSFYTLVSHLNDMVDAGALGDANLFPGNTNAVRVMNLHKAKGLEARVVILAEPLAGKEHEPKFHVDRASAPARGYFTISRKKGWRVERIAQPAGWDGIAAEEQRFLDAEEERLLYVAATRAADVLVVCGRADMPERNRWRVLFDRIPEENVLEPPDVPTVPLSEVTVKKKELESAAKAVRETVSTLAKESWSETTVTKVAKKDIELPVFSAEGRGMKWGRIIHGALEAMGRGLDGEKLERFVKNALVAEEVPAGKYDEIAGELWKIKETELWQRMLKSEKRLFEVPFAVRTTAKGLGDSNLAPGQPVILRGQIDLVFRESTGWVIVDYKSDVIKNNLEELTAFYSPQLRLYAKFWRRLTDEPVSEVLLHFISDNCKVEVTIG